MRVLLILLCAGAIFVSTCTYSFDQFIQFGEIRFKWERHPNLSVFLEPLPSHLSGDFLLQKVGHFSAFFILTLLLQSRFQAKGVALILAISYGVFTEILQLYFNRDGRLFDIGFDSAGVFIALFVSSFIPRQQSRDIHFK
ncbi:VanZ family protein [Neobacillus sp. GCM10023253]|uniref:VanZ family protein n=1 Tax=Neobacillus sp. GCM10023253 TaxID=3252644 RepID=UPI003622E66C